MTDTIAAALIAGVAGVGGALGGAALQHQFETLRARDARASAKQDEAESRVAENADHYVSEFLQTAYTNLRYLTRDRAREGITTMADFSVLARRASLYLDDELDKVLNQYTTDYAQALVNLGEPRNTAASVGAQNFANFHPRLDALHKRLKAAIQDPTRLSESR